MAGGHVVYHIIHIREANVARKGGIGRLPCKAERISYHQTNFGAREISSSSNILFVFLARPLIE